MTAFFFPAAEGIPARLGDASAFVADANTATDSGWYHGEAGSKNFSDPSRPLLAIRRENGNEVSQIQLAASGRLATRQFNGTAWTGWGAPVYAADLSRDTATDGGYWNSSAGVNVDEAAPGSGDGLYSAGNAGTFPDAEGIVLWWIETQNTYNGAAMVQNAFSYHPNAPKNLRFVRERAANGAWSDWEQIVTPEVLRRRYIDVADFVPSDDTKECHAGTQAAFSMGEGREIVFTNPKGGTRAYRYLDRNLGRLILPARGARVICEPAALLDWSGWTVGEGSVAQPLMEGKRANHGEDAVTKAVYAGAKAVSLSPEAATKYAAGGWAQLTSDDMFTSEDGPGGEHGEWVFVEGVDAQNRAALAWAVSGHYVTAPRLKLMDGRAAMRFEGVNMRGPGAFAAPMATGDRGIRLIDFDQVAIDGGEISGADCHAVQLVNAAEWSFRDFVARIDASSDDRLQYPVVVSGMSHSGLWDGGGVIGGREGFCLSVYGIAEDIDAGQDAYGTTRNTTLRGGFSRGQRRSGIASHDNHAEMHIDGWRFEDCEQFIDIRFRKARITNCSGKGSGAFAGNLDCAVQLGSGAGEIHASGNVWEDVLRGYFMSPAVEHETAPGDVSIRGDKIRGTRCVRGLSLEFGGSAAPGYAAADADLGALVVEGVDFQLSTAASAAAVETQGRWTDALISGRFTGGNGTSAAVFMHGSALGGAGFGPVNPAVNVGYGPGFTSAALIQHHTGTAKTRFYGIGHSPAGEVF